MKRYWGILLAIVLTLAVAVPAWAIISGEPDGEGHPYVGMLIFYNDQGTAAWRCTGTLVSPTVVLTAAHCTAGAASAQVWFDAKVIAGPGSYPYSGGTTGVPISHPSYDDFATFPNTSDVGVVVLDEPVTMDTYGAVAAVGALDGSDTARGLQEQVYTVVGYGLQSVVPSLQADTERYVAHSALITLRSALTDGWNIHLTNNPGEGRGAKGGTCFGDSGGPTFIKGTNQIVGITSFGTKNCVGGGYAYRIDTDHAQSFIAPYLAD